MASTPHAAGSSKVTPRGAGVVVGAAHALLLGTSVLGCVEPMAMPDASAIRDAGPPRDAARPDSGLDAPIEPTDLVAALADPYAPARLRPGTPYLVSSREPEPPEGLLNLDHSHFVREEDGRGVMIERRGPGAVTRWWMTIGDIPDPEGIRVRFWVDGVEMDPDGGEPGITLGELTSGRYDGFAAPFTLDRTGTSGGFVVSRPIHYQRSFRADVQRTVGWTYFQFEGFDYEPDTVVEPFTYPPTEAVRTALAEAASLWVDHDHPGIERLGDMVSLEAGAATELSWTGPGVATSVVLSVPRAERADVRLQIVADGAIALDAPLSWVSGGDVPAALSHRSALFVVSPDSVRLHHPVPFSDALTVRLVAPSTRRIERVQIAGRVVEGPLAEDLGRLRTDCGVHGPVPSISMCGTMDASLRAPNNVVAQYSGGRGQYVGHSLVQDVSSAWWCALEPDHEIWIDGRYAILGTGMEDYYSAGFYFMNGPVQWALAGATAWERDDMAAASTHVYRHHLVDGIPFESELRFEFESYVEETIFTGCAFFYVAPD